MSYNTAALLITRSIVVLFGLGVGMCWAGQHWDNRIIWFLGHGLLGIAGACMLGFAVLTVIVIAKAFWRR
jgi:hypothetical protein